MVAKNLLHDVLALPPADRLELVRQLWDSLLDDPKSLPLTDATRQELDRRYEDYLRNPEEGSTWDEVEALSVRGLFHRYLTSRIFLQTRPR